MITRIDSRSGRFYDVPLDDGTVGHFPSVTTILSAIAKPALVGWAAREERTLVSEIAADLYVEERPHLPRTAFLVALAARIGTTKAHVKALTAAGEIGTAIHHKIEWHLKRQLGQHVGPEPVLVDAAEWAYMSWCDLAKATALEPICVEKIVWSSAHQYAGTLDHVVTLDARGLLTILEKQGPVEVTLADWLLNQARVTALCDIKSGKNIYPTEAFLQSVAYQRAYSEMGHGRTDGGLIVRVPKVTTDPGFQVAVVPPASELFPTFLATRQLWEWTFKNDQAWRAQAKVK